VIVKAVKHLEIFYFLREKDFFYVPDVPNVPLHPFGGSITAYEDNPAHIYRCLAKTKQLLIPAKFCHLTFD